MLNVVIVLWISHYYFFSIFVSFTCASIVRLVLGQIVKGGKLHVHARNKTVFENGPFVTYMYCTSLKWLEQMMKLLIHNISPGKCDKRVVYTWTVA
jgi:hypothetical protein